MINVLFTILKAEFKDWVEERIQERNAGLDEESHVLMDRQVAERFQQSTAKSCK